MTTYYSEDHEWITVTGDVATLGITKHAADQLGEIVFFEPQDPGEEFSKGDEIGVVESVKAASEIYAPISGEIVEANGDLEDAPGKLNEDPEGTAWLYKVKINDPSELEGLMDADAYSALIS